MARRFFTSESVTEGHPDKIADQISDAILDDILSQDKKARVACETVCTTGLVLVCGEITTSAYANIQEIVRNTVKEIGYDRGKYGFDADNLAVLSAIDPQSADIAMGVNDDKHEQGAGDQGMMFGFACDETEELMPLPIMLAHKLAKRLTEIRKQGLVNYLRPDGKTQVTLCYEDDKPLYVDTIVISTQHDDKVSHEQIEADLKELVINAVVEPKLMRKETKIFVNPTGRFVIGGPAGDSGLTGRKIIVDTYGGYACHGGGAFSGKDPSKVDRSAAYMARYIAKNLVAAGLMDKCEIQLAYAIGCSEPVSVHVDSFGTAKLPEEKIVEIICKVFDLRPGMIIKNFSLTKPSFEYHKLTNYGHLGPPDLDIPWEKLDKVEEIKKLIK